MVVMKVLTMQVQTDKTDISSGYRKATFLCASFIYVCELCEAISDRKNLYHIILVLCGV